MKNKTIMIMLAAVVALSVMACAGKNEATQTVAEPEAVSEAGDEQSGEQQAAGEEPEGEQSADSELKKKTLDSLSKISDKIYMMDCYTDYMVDEYLTEGITDVEQFDIWMTENLTDGVPTGDIPDMGCSSFVTVSPEGDHLFARNYDMAKDGDSLIIRTYPEDGYSSIGIVDLSHVNLGKYGKYDIEDESSRSLLFAAPWCICDAVNEKGFGASLLSLSNQHKVNDSGKPDLLLYSVMRVVIDKCATVDEAVKLLEEYDIYSPGHHTYHVFMTDTSGRAVTVEWTDEGEMTVIEDTAVTNFFLYPGRSTLDPDQRYTKIHRSIDEAETLTSAEAMEILSSVSRDTQWSAIYDLESFSVDICFNMDFDKTHSYSGVKSGQ